MVKTGKPDGTHRYTWLGENEPHLDEPTVVECGRTVLGMYGGHSGAGALKNEDAALILTDTAGDWEFALLVDAHYSSESAQMLLDLISGEASTIRDILEDAPLETMFRTLEDHFVQLFSSPESLSRALEVEGEASCLLVARNHSFLWWMSVGDCLAYLLHPQLAARGQYTVNQRNFFEWIGFRNTFTNVVPCYASGVRKLLPGRSVICLATDGVFEGDDQPLIPDVHLYQAYMRAQDPTATGLRARTSVLLDRVHQLKGRDSATIIVWGYDDEDGSI